MDPNELVSMMEHNFDYSMKSFHELCESHLCMGIGKKIYGERKDEDGKNIFDVN